MTRSRRSLLAALVGLAGASGCLRGSTEEPRRPPRVPATTKTTKTRWTYTPIDPVKPDIEGQELIEGDDGNLTIAAELRNEARTSVNGTLHTYVTVNGTEKHVRTPFSLAKDETGRVNVSVPVDFETFMANPELRLSVTVRETTPSPTTT